MFNINRFEQKQFKDRTAEIKVPELAEFFDNDAPAVWTIKCLSGVELAKVNDAVEQNNSIQDLIKSLVSKDTPEKVEAIKEIIGISTEKVPNDTVRRLRMLNLGSISPECPEHIAVKLAENFPTTFYSLTNEIIKLTGLGRLGE